MYRYGCKALSESKCTDIDPQPQPQPDSILTATKTYFWEEYEHILMGAS